MQFVNCTALDAISYTTLTSSVARGGGGGDSLRALYRFDFYSYSRQPKDI